MSRALDFAVTNGMLESEHSSTIKSPIPPILGIPEAFAKATIDGHKGNSNGQERLSSGHERLSNDHEGLANSYGSVSNGHDGVSGSHHLNLPNGHHHDLRCSSEESGQTGDALEPIAVIGLALKFPQDATSPEAFWQMLMEGRSAMTNVPKERFNVDAFYKSASSKTRGVSFHA
jgi:Beta-ketoacyl synthase, N-terminal domain